MAITFPKKDPVVKSYTGLRLRQVIRSDGRKFEPVGGLFTPKDEEEQALCDYYVSIGRMVEGFAEEEQTPVVPVEADLE